MWQLWHHHSKVQLNYDLVIIDFDDEIIAFIRYLIIDWWRESMSLIQMIPDCPVVINFILVKFLFYFMTLELRNRPFLKKLKNDMPWFIRKSAAGPSSSSWVFPSLIKTWLKISIHFVISSALFYWTDKETISDWV